MTISLREVFNRQGTLGTNVSFRQLLATLPFGLTIGLRELHQRLPFPENEVEVMPAYITPELLGILPTVTEALNRQLVIYERDDIQQDRPENQPAIAVNNSRKVLRQFLQDPNFQRAFVEDPPPEAGEPPPEEGERPPSLLDKLYLTIRSRQRFHTALQLIEGLHPVSGSFFNIDEALRSESLRFTVGAPGGPGLALTLQGYQGPNLDQAKRSQLNDARAFLSETSPERRFRGGLWRGDIHFALREFEEAILEYDAIRRELSTLQLSRERRKFLAIRSGFAHLGRGDQLYKSTRDLSSNLAEQAKAEYREAVKVIEDHEVSEANPFHQEIKDYANKRMTQLSNFINFLGYSNAYVPAGPRFGGLNDNDSMFGLAMARVSAAQEVGDKFVSYLQAAEQAELAVKEAENAIVEAEASISNANRRREQTAERRRLASARQESVKRKNGLLQIATYLDVIEAVGSTIGAAVTGNPAAAPFVTHAGAVSFGLKTAASLEELSFEERLAESDLSIAESEVVIADLEVLIAESRKSFLEEKKAFLVEGAELNLEVYYALAREYERLTEEHMEAAIKIAFLAERRAAFEGGDPTLPQVKLEYIKRADDPADDRGVGGLIIAPDLLKEDLVELNQSFQLGGQRPTDFDLQISLMNDYPIEFSAFLQSGILPFKISLYDLDRFRAGTSDQRIKTVHIEIVGLGAALPNISGRLRHSGTFMVRDRASAADAERLLPTPEELDEALDIFQQGGMSTVTTKGITLWQVDLREKELTNLQDDPDIEEFRDYGLTGLWEFELPPSNNPGINFQNIADIIIRINGEATAGDPVFRAHIRDLVKKYEKDQQPQGQDEALDRTTALSMKRSFLRDAFSDLLATGAMTFELRAATFPDDKIAGAKVKTVLFQAIDAQGRGVEGLRLIVSKEGASVSFDRTTLANGFSEDITTDIPFLEPALRFSMEGPWRIEAADMTRLAVVHDLILFFIYELPEGAGGE